MQHLLLLCPNAHNIWNDIDIIWQEITGTYEDFVDSPVELDYKTKLFGINTPLKPKPTSNKDINKIILLTALDILVGNAQFTLIKQHKNFLRTNKAPNITETIFIFHQNMTDSMNKIITRMRKKPYDSRWLFNKPKNTSRHTTRTNWKDFFKELLTLSLKSYNEVLTENNFTQELTLTSQLDSDQENNFIEQH